jgi:hypothetical protein
MKVLCVFPTFLENGGYIVRDQIVDIDPTLTNSAKIRRNFRLPDGNPIEPMTELADVLPSTTDEEEGDIAGLLLLSKEELIRKANNLGIAASARSTKETIARMIAEASTPTY